MLSEAWDALNGDATSRKAADGENGEEVSFRTANAATVEGVGDERGEGEVAPGRKASRAMAVTSSLDARITQLRLQANSGCSRQCCLALQVCLNHGDVMLANAARYNSGESNTLLLGRLDDGLRVPSWTVQVRVAAGSRVKSSVGSNSGARRRPFCRSHVLQVQL